MNAQWRCRVCSYLHRGDQPPSACPVCNSPRDRFTAADDDRPTAAHAPAEAATAIAAEPLAEPRRWRCSVCGYIHTGPEPPEKCPVCGADRSKFVRIEPEAEIEKETPASSPGPSSTRQSAYQRIYPMVTEHMTALHAHPISVHIPNGVAPVAVLFVLLSWFFNSSSLETAAFCNMVIVLLAMPLVLFSGYNDWQRRFGGHMTRVFMGKMCCGGIFLSLSLCIVLWRAADPQIMGSPGSGRTLYILLHLLLLFVGAMAGYLGGKLVFPNHQ